jgi:hypothetical protein
MNKRKKLHKTLLKRLDVKDAVAVATGEKWSGKGNVRCPFAEKRHESGEDSKPSLSVRVTDGASFCHACGYKASSVIGLYQDAQSVPYDQALEELWNEFVEPVVPTADVEQARDALLDNDLMLVRLKEKRGVTRETVKRFSLGWRANRLWIPIQNRYGLVVDVRKYDLLGRGKAGAKVISYKKGYGKARVFPEESMSSPALILCEGEMDAVLGCQHGVGAVTLTTGAMTMSEQLAKRFANKTVVIVPDNDKAGRNGAAKRATLLSAAGASVSIAKLPVKKKGEDLTDWILKYKGDPRELTGMAAEPGAEDAEPEQREGEPPFAMTERETVQVARSESVLANLLGRGAFYTDEAAVYYARSDTTQTIKVDDKEFAAFLGVLHPAINRATQDGRFILNHVQNSAKQRATPVRMGAWALYADPTSIYVYSQPDKIVRVNPDGVKVVPNAVNDDGILLEARAQASGVQFDRSVTIEAALKKLWGLVAGNIACAEEYRYLTVCWLIGILFREYIRPKPLLRFVAKTGGGKSGACKLIAALVYGADWEEQMQNQSTTLAAHYDAARTHPLQIIDNLETRNMSDEKEDFLLIAATGGTKAKRKRDSDTGVVYERTNCLIVSNGIEPFNKHELIARNIEIELDLAAHGKRPYHEFQAVASVMAARDEIMSGLLKMARRHVFPRIRDGEVARIAREFGPHSMDRFNDYLALMACFLDAIWAFLPSDRYSTPRRLVQRWLELMDWSAEAQKESTNDVLYYLSELMERGEGVLGVKTEVGKGDNGSVKFKASTRQLLTDFRVLAKHLGARCPWQNERQLGARISDAADVLARSGWTRDKKAAMGRMYYVYRFDPSTIEKEGTR